MTIRECLEKHNQFHALDIWDNELNGGTPNEVQYHQKSKYYFKCEQGLHESSLYDLSHIYNGKLLRFKCRKCNSFGQQIINKFGKEFLDKIWSDKNEMSAFDITYSYNKSLWFNCENGIHESYQRRGDTSYRLGCRCPECSNLIRPSKAQNLVGQKFGRLTVKDKAGYFKSKGGTYYLCDCDCGNKDIKVLGSVLKSGKQVSCGCWRVEQHTGENNPNWKGGILSEQRKERNSKAYTVWRDAVYERDDYTCQCCGQRGGKLNAHHIKSFSKYPSLRFEVSNGITLCENCHAWEYEGSLHNIYGSQNVTPEQLYEYINQKKINIA